MAPPSPAPGEDMCCDDDGDLLSVLDDFGGCEARGGGVGGSAASGPGRVRSFDNGSDQGWGSGLRWVPCPSCGPGACGCFG